MSSDAHLALESDKRDELARFRDEFVIDNPDLIYLDGNSLGRLPRRTAQLLRDVVDRQWGDRLIRGWNEGWFTAARRIGEKIGKVIGARADEVIVADSTSVNLFKLVMALIRQQPQRCTIVTDDLNFPSDHYVLQGAIQLAGPSHRLKVVPSADGIITASHALSQAIDDRTALVTLTHTSFKSGFVYDMKAVTEIAQTAGAAMLWDLCHSVGAMPLDLGAARVDLAVGCTYKYLNAGPGAPAFLYVRRDLQDRLQSPIWGWFGQHRPFDFARTYAPAVGIERFQAGTPPILSLCAIEPGIDLVLEAGLEQIRQKSTRQTEYLIALWKEQLAPLGVTLKSPHDYRQRGSHVAFGHPEAFRIAQALIAEMNVIPDFRQPDNIRFGISPLYNTFWEIHEAVRRFRTVIVERRFEAYSNQTGLEVV